MGLFSLETPFLTRYRVYYLPSYAESRPHIPRNEVADDWIVQNMDTNATRNYDTKQQAEKEAKKFAKQRKPSEVYVYNKDGNGHEKSEYHGEHVFGDRLRDLPQNLHSRRGSHFK